MPNNSIRSALATDEVQEHIRQLRLLARHVWQHFKEDRCFDEAASLGYTSLLALVPLLAVIFVVVSAFPVFSEWSDGLQQLLVENLVPTAGKQIGAGINSFLDSVSGLTLPGTVALVLTALMLMFRIEVAFNRIWRVERARSFINRIIMYWAVLTLAPLMIGGAMVFSAQNLITGQGLQELVSPGLYRLGLFLLGTMVFTLIFMLVPNCRVRFRAALSGAVLSAFLFEVAKFGFVAWVSNANYAVIYGALATVPIFLLWLYLVWIVVLLGASLAASLTTFRNSNLASADWPKGADFQLAYRLMGHLWHAQTQGEALTQEELIGLEPHANALQVNHILHNMFLAKIATVDDSGDWMLTRDLGNFTLLALYLSGNYHLPILGSNRVFQETDWDREFAAAIKDVHDSGINTLNRPLRPMYTGSTE
ncbi:MAG TPA: YihY family inner membrane protein [Xanthomonadales bacterium]|nr:YihY family inner membrane protein [Xanthomonadales bacterium]